MAFAFERIQIGSHEAVYRFEDDEVIGFIAVHSTVLGPAFGGVRLWHYDNEVQALTDALRLSEGMTYKNAVADLCVGGGKSTLFPKRKDFDRKKVFATFGQAVDRLGGGYITAEDVGTGVADMLVMREHTRHVAGLPSSEDMAGGDPSPWTALGTFEAMKLAVRHRLGSSLEGLTVGVQGVGNVGRYLCQLLKSAGAELIIADAQAARVAEVAAAFDATVVSPSEIIQSRVDVFAPCALGGILDPHSIASLQAPIVVGAANNQLLDPRTDAEALLARDILYAPDFVVNAGGVVNVLGEYRNRSVEAVRADVLEIGPRLLDILRSAQAQGRTPLAIAHDMANSALAAGRTAPASAAHG